ncbi:MAG: Uma2 family endonuclease [Pyrinomonadaceae bacterium]|nr:Uma2 family endonuclease [Pyrinomonadaceae bacterium]
MAAVLELSKPKLTKNEVLYGVSWEMYDELVADNRNSQFPRLTYDSGILEITMSNSLQHEEDSRNLAALFEQIAVELEVNFRRSGSTTFRRKNISKGFEPDSCFYIQSLEKIVGKEDLNSEVDPPPDLIIEINKTSSPRQRMPIFAAFGVAEVWRFTKKQVKFYVLREGVYLEAKMSLALPILASEQATDFLLDARTMSSTAWAKLLRNWIASAKIDWVK